MLVNGQQVDTLCRVERAGHVAAQSDIKSCRIDAIGSEHTARNRVHRIGPTQKPGAAGETFTVYLEAVTTSGMAVI